MFDYSWKAKMQTFTFLSSLEQVHTCKIQRRFLRII